MIILAVKLTAKMFVLVVWTCVRLWVHRLTGSHLWCAWKSWRTACPGARPWGSPWRARPSNPACSAAPFDPPAACAWEDETRRRISSFWGVWWGLGPSWPRSLHSALWSYPSSWSCRSPCQAIFSCVYDDRSPVQPTSLKRRTKSCPQLWASQPTCRLFCCASWPA